MNKIAISAVFAVVFLLASFTAWAADSDKKGTVSSLSASMISVPNVCDMSLSKAISTLTAAGLKPQTQLSDRDGQARICIRQNPEAGERVPKGTTVNIYGQLANDAKGKVVIPSR
jgi:beta-lactam-binding protein with PASTA domain